MLLNSKNKEANRRVKVENETKLSAHADIPFV